MVYYYKYYKSGHYPSSCLLFKTQLNSIGFSVISHETHYVSAMSPTVNAIYRFVTMVYYYKYHKSGEYPSSCLLFQNTTFRRLDCLRLQVEPT
jgi:hypothetical protein